MREQERSPYLELSLSLLLPLAALGMQGLLWPWIEPFVWFFFYPAVFFSARFGGLRSGVASTLLSTLFVWHFFIPPRFSWQIDNPNAIWSMMLFFIMGCLISEAMGRLRVSKAVGYRLGAHNWRYAAVLGALAMLSIFSYATFDELIARENKSTEEINIAGRQRMLSQRINYLSEKHKDSREAAERQALRQEIDDNISLMESSHQKLLGGNPDFGLTGIRSPGIAAHYFGPKAFLDEDIRSFIQRSRDFLDQETPDLDIKSLEETQAAIKSRLLAQLDAVTLQYQTESRQTVGSLRLQAQVSLGAMLTFLVISWLAVFRPQAQRIAENIRHLEESERRARGIHEAALDGIISIDESGSVIDFNPSAERIFGCRRDDALGRNIADVIIPDRYRTRHHQGLDRYVATGEGAIIGQRLEISAVHASGREFPVELSVTEVMHGNQRIFTAFLRDLTLVKEHEAALRKLSLAVEQSPTSVVITDAKGMIEYVNAKFEQISGYSRQEAIGNNPRILKSGEKGQDEYGDMWRAITSGKEWRGEFHNKRKDGTLYWETALISPIKDDQGRITNFLAIKEDITEQRQIEHALRRSQKMEAVGQLSGGLAHDFNNILGIIGGNLEMLRPMVADKEKAVRRIETALRNVERAAKLTRRLLNFSRQQPQPNAPVSVNEIITGMSELLEKSLTINIAVELHLDDKVCMAKIDAGDFEDVMINLALNARDAMPEGGRIVIETENVMLDDGYVAVNPDTAAGPYVRISVSDTGTGMSRETLERIFEPFFTTKPASAGTGLGLSMVYGFVKRSRGHIKVYSEPGQGTTFRIYLPCAASKEVVAPGQANFETGLQVGNETILVVDDEAELLEVACDQLSQAGYKIMTASNAEDALKLIDANPLIDLLFSDLVLSCGMNGYELAQEAVRRRPGLRYLLTSGYTQNLLNAKPDGAKPVYFLPKPYSPLELARQIRQALDKPEPQS